MPQVEKFKHLRILFMSERRREQIGAAAAVMLGIKAKFSIYWPVYVPTLTCGHELWVVTERTRSWIQAAEISFLRRVAGLSFSDTMSLAVTSPRRMQLFFC